MFLFNEWKPLFSELQLFDKRGPFCELEKQGRIRLIWQKSQVSVKRSFSLFIWTIARWIYSCLDMQIHQFRWFRISHLTCECLLTHTNGQTWVWRLQGLIQTESLFPSSTNYSRVRVSQITLMQVIESDVKMTPANPSFAAVAAETWKPDLISSSLRQYMPFVFF